MEIKGEHLLFLFGAGASVDAGIPMSNQMVVKIEELVDQDVNWKDFRDLYFYLKSSIHYSDGILGKFNEPFNVERLLIVISEIEKRESNIMYPFIGTWNIRLVDLAGANFENLRKLHKLIRRQLNEWVALRSYDGADYYQSFVSLSSDIGQLIKIFTLNYDLCFETVVGKEKVIESGFTKATSEWHQSNFEQDAGKHFNLYKLHGSVDWYTKDNKLYRSEKIESEPELIFGIQHKMTSVDPYFYYSYILRNSCLYEAKIIVVVGYAFADDYINIILTQALNARSELRLIVISPFSGKTDDDAKREIQQKLRLKENTQLIIVRKKAKDFMQTTMNKDFFQANIGEATDAPFKA